MPRKKENTTETRGVFVRLPVPLVDMIDVFVKNNMYYRDRSQYIRIAIVERARRDAIVKHTDYREEKRENQAVGDDIPK